MPRKEMTPFLSVTKLFVLLEMFKHIQFVLLNVYFRKLETHTHLMLYENTV